jgi:hypothetical protein
MKLYFPIIANTILNNIASSIPSNVIPLNMEIPYFLNQAPITITLSNKNIVLSKFSFSDNSLSLDEFINSYPNAIPMIDFKNIGLINYALQKNYKFGIFGDNYININENEEKTLPNLPFVIYKAYSSLSNLVCYSDYAGYRLFDEDDNQEVNFGVIKKSAQIHLYSTNGLQVIHKKIKNLNERPSQYGQSMQDLAGWLNPQNIFLHQNNCYGCENMISKNSFNFYTLKSYAIAHNIKSIADSL